MERLLLVAMRQPEGMSGKSPMRNAGGGNSDHSNEDPLLSDRQGVGALLQPLSPWAFASWVLRRASAGPKALTSMATVSLAYPHPARDGSPVHMHQLPHDSCPHQGLLPPQRLLALHLFLAGQNSCALRQSGAELRWVTHTEVGHN